MVLQTTTATSSGNGSQVVASVLASHVANGHPTESGFTLAFTLAAGVLVAAIFAGMAIPGRRAADALVPVAAR